MLQSWTNNSATNTLWLIDIALETGQVMGDVDGDVPFPSYITKGKLQ